MIRENWTKEFKSRIHETGCIISYGSKKTWILSKDLLSLASCRWICADNDIVMQDVDEEEGCVYPYQAEIFDTPECIKKGMDFH